MTKLEAEWRRLLLRRWRSFGYAFQGVAYTLRTQPNTWIHTVATAAALLLGLWLELSRQEWALIVLAAVAVWAAEFLNTAIEAAVDMAMPGEHPLAKAAKDAAAGAVLIAAAGAVIIGLLILGPPLWTKLTGS